MTPPNLDWSLLPGLLLLLIPVAFALVATLPVKRESSAAPWRRARAAAVLAFALAVTAALARLLAGEDSYRLLTLVPLGPLGSLAISLRLDTLTVVMLLLVCFVGGLILQFSRTYLQGEVGQPRYVRAFAATLAGVTLLVMANNLLLLALAWIATSLALHKLLTFYADRPQAQLAAHKKFLASRAADIFLLAATVLIGLRFGTLEIDEVLARLAAAEGWSPALEIAAVLLVAGAALKCAQLPVHGWLIQVMEAPTPVSALLHAGVVNMGGFLMIRLAPLMAQAEIAQTLLVIVGTMTAVLASLVMMTRVSIKVGLAWSTCAQMGFMLLQCGLGAWSLALLHLVAHSLYKAHAFLIAGSRVEQWRTADLVAERVPAGPARWLAAALVGLLTTASVAAVFGLNPGQEPVVFALASIAGLALTPLLVRATDRGPGGFLRIVAGSGGVAILYFGWHSLAAHLVPTGDEAPTATATRIAIVLAGFGLLFALQATISSRPTGPVARALHPRLFAGLHLDEWFTRLTLRAWPPPAVPASQSERPCEPETRRERCP